MKKTIFFIGLFCALAGCSQRNDPQVDQLQNSVSQLSDKVTQLSILSSNENVEVNYLLKQDGIHWNNTSNFAQSIDYIWNAEQTTASNLQTLTLQYNLSTSPNGYVQINTQGRGYSNLKTPYGVLLISTESVEPYLDGYKIHLSIGNPMYAFFNGFSLICSTYDSTNIFRTMHSMTNDMTDSLNPGTWNKITFILAPANMDEVRNASISIELNEVNFLKPTETQ